MKRRTEWRCLTHNMKTFPRQALTCHTRVVCACSRNVRSCVFCSIRLPRLDRFSVMNGLSSLSGEGSRCVFLLFACSPSNSSPATVRRCYKMYCSPERILLIPCAFRKYDVISCIDTTFCTPVNHKPIEIGADIVLHSGTKYLAGHNDVMCGALAGRCENLCHLFVLPIVALHLYTRAAFTGQNYKQERKMPTDSLLILVSTQAHMRRILVTAFCHRPSIHISLMHANVLNLMT